MQTPRAALHPITPNQHQLPLSQKTPTSQPSWLKKALKENDQTTPINRKISTKNTAFKTRDAAQQVAPQKILCQPDSGQRAGPPSSRKLC